MSLPGGIIYMENADKKLDRLKDKIEDLKRRNIKSKEWKLTNKERKFVEELLGKENVVPTIYQIYTKSFKDLHSITSSIVKEVHLAHKAGKKTIGRPLKKQEMEDLEKYHINYRPIKCRIYL